jgi:hypothetical protein
VLRNVGIFPVSWLFCMFRNVKDVRPLPNVGGRDPVSTLLLRLSDASRENALIELGMVPIKLLLERESVDKLVAPVQVTPNHDVEHGSVVELLQPVLVVQPEPAVAVYNEVSADFCVVVNAPEDISADSRMTVTAVTTKGSATREGTPCSLCSI